MENRIVTGKIRIVSDGHGANTLVLDERGQPLPLAIARIDVAITPTDPTRAVLEIALSHLDGDVPAEAVYLLADPRSGVTRPVRYVEFWDGSSLQFPKPADWIARPPTGCRDPSACARSGQCETAGCPHRGWTAVRHGGYL